MPMRNKIANYADQEALALASGCFQGYIFHRSFDDQFSIGKLVQPKKHEVNAQSVMDVDVEYEPTSFEEGLDMQKKHIHD